MTKAGGTIQFIPTWNAFDNERELKKRNPERSGELEVPCTQTQNGKDHFRPAPSLPYPAHSHPSLRSRAGSEVAPRSVRETSESRAISFCRPRFLQAVAVPGCCRETVQKTGLLQERIGH